MLKRMEIEDYNPKRGITETVGSLDVLGINVKGNHYIVMKEEFENPKHIGERIMAPDKAYRMVEYNPNTKIATVEEVTDESLLKRIGVEFYMEDFDFNLEKFCNEKKDELFDEYEFSSWIEKNKLVDEE